ncbi:MAG: YitT family protein [Eubacterium sp.]|nr:YitT family protein [Eubacterium sp.]
MTTEKKSKKAKTAKKAKTPKNKEPLNVKKLLRDILIIIIGSFLFACGLKTFAAPNDIASGGISGIAIIISHFTGLNEGILYLLINIPIMIIGFIFLGKLLMFKTILSIITVTVATDYVFEFLPKYEGDMILAAIFGGILMGAGLGLCYYCEGTSGGTDIINKLINRKFPQMSLGVITFTGDMCVILLAIVAFRNVEAGLYSLIAIFVSSKIMDTLIYGSYEGKMLLIFSRRYEEISQKIISSDRGVTFLHGTGAYHGDDVKVICCAVHKNEYVKVKRFVKEIDPRAFMIITSAKEVLGEGFQQIN